jgi:hypothetical protein
VSGTVTLRAGPASVYPEVASLQGGETGRPLGQTEAGDWLLIVLEVGDEGWLPAGSFVIAEGSASLPVITDLPPTPTLPPVTPTYTVPPPTATSTPSPYTCDLSASRDGRYVVVVGLNWPPKAPITVTVTRHYNAPVPPSSTFTDPTITTGDADDEIPFGFRFRWLTSVAYFDGTTWLQADGPTTYTLSTWACSSSVMTSP